MTATPRRRLATLASAVVALATAAALVPGSAGAEVAAGTAANSRNDAYGWLARQINADGVIYNAQYDFTDIGLTIDTAGALRGSGRFAGTIARADKALRANAKAYSGSTGGAAKLAAYATDAGLDATSFGGVDLVAKVEGAIATSAPIAGRLQQSENDYNNVLTQAYAVEALARSKSTKTRSALSFLLRQQCSDGAFRESLTEDKTAAEQGCVDGAAGNEPSTDATASAVLALVDVRGYSSLTGPALTKARRWLIDHQYSSGAFTQGTGTAVNTNSTGLAGAALGALQACGPASDAARFVFGRQVLRTATGKLGTQDGAIAYDTAAYRAGQSDGITVETRDQWRRASAQAAPSLENLRVIECRS